MRAAAVLVLTACGSVYVVEGDRGRAGDGGGAGQASGPSSATSTASSTASTGGAGGQSDGGMGGTAGAGGEGSTGGDPTPPECTEPSDCGMGGPCHADLCNAGVCGVHLTPKGDPAAEQASGDCKLLVCTGTGKEPAQSHDDSDVHDDADPCTADSCGPDGPVHEPIPGC